jgi:hypothetical protein
VCVGFLKAGEDRVRDDVLDATASANRITVNA